MPTPGILPQNYKDCLLTKCIDCCYYNDGVFTVCPDWHESPKTKISARLFNEHSPEWRERTLARWNKESKEYWEKIKMDTVEDIDETITEASEMINKHYEQLLHELFTLGDYMFDLRIEYKDVDGKTISMSQQDRDKRVMYLQGE